MGEGDIGGGPIAADNQTWSRGRQDSACQGPGATSEVEPGALRGEAQPADESSRNSAAPTTTVGLICGTAVPDVSYHGDLQSMGITV